MALATLLSGAAVGQSRPDSAEILRKVSQTYAAVKQYLLESEGTQRHGVDGPGHMKLAVKLPNRYRMEGMVPLSGDASDFGDSVIVCDGSLIWFYIRKTNQYASFPLSEATAGAPETLETCDRTRSTSSPSLGSATLRISSTVLNFSAKT